MPQAILKNIWYLIYLTNSQSDKFRLVWTLGCKVFIFLMISFSEYLFWYFICFSKSELAAISSLFRSGHKVRLGEQLHMASTIPPGKYGVETKTNPSWWSWKIQSLKTCIWKRKKKKLDKGRSFYEVHMMWILFQYFIKSRSQSSVDSI